MAKEPTAKERIDYLVARRFPLSRLLNLPPNYSLRSGPPSDTHQLRSEVEEFSRELASLPLEQLVVRYEEAKRGEFEQLRAKAKDDESGRFFNQPSAQADFGHWAKAAHWTLDEAIALSFGRAPELVRWEKLKSLTQLGSPFVFHYARRRDLALRAMAWQQLFDPVLPGIFLAWAKRTDIELPPELIASVEKFGGQIADWKSLYEKAKSALERQQSVHESQIADWVQLYNEANAHRKTENSDWQGIIEKRDQVIAEQRERLALLETPRSTEEKAVGTKERESLLKMIVGMARGGYAYDPKLNRSPVPQEISDDLAKFGVDLDVDTVRKWLREAAEILPRE